MDPKKEMYRKRGAILAGNLTRRQFDAYYCDSREEALQKALELVPDGATVGWGGAMSAQQIGLMDALRSKPVTLFDRETAQSQEERTAILKQCLTANVFLTGANALSLDGQMVNIDGTGNRAAAIAFGPDTVLVIAGMNKVCDTLEQAVIRARWRLRPTSNVFPMTPPASALAPARTASALIASAISCSSPAIAVRRAESNSSW